MKKADNKNLRIHNSVNLSANQLGIVISVAAIFLTLIFVIVSLGTSFKLGWSLIGLCISLAFVFLPRIFLEAKARLTSFLEFASDAYYLEAVKEIDNNYLYEYLSQEVVLMRDNTIGENSEIERLINELRGKKRTGGSFNWKNEVTIESWQKRKILLC